MSERISPHFWLLAEVRWQIFRNSLRFGRKRLELAAQAFLATLGTLIGLGVGLLMGGATYLLLSRGKTVIVPGLLEFIFLAWLFGPILVEGFTPALDFREIARFPVTFRLYYLLNTAYGLLDPWALLCLAWLGCIWLGLAAARPAWAVPAAFSFLGFSLINLLFSRALFAVLEPVLSTRRGRERLLAVVFSLVLLSQIFIYGVLPRWGKPAIETFVQTLLFVHRALPPGLAWRALSGGGWVDLLAGLWAFLGYAGLSALIVRRGLLKIFRGELTVETSPFRGVVQMQPGWKLPFLGEATSAIIEKEFHYSAHDPRSWLACAAGPFMTLMFSLSADALRKFGVEPKAGFGFLYPVLAGYVLIGFSQQLFNSFAYDGRGFQVYLVSPVPGQWVLAAKNLATGGWALVSFLAVTLLCFGKGVLNKQLVMVTAGFVYAALAMLGAGNLLSVWFPTRMEVGRMSGAKPSPAAALVGIMAHIVILGSFGLLIYIPHRWELGWFPFVALAAMVLLSLAFYLHSLRSASSYMRRNAEEIVAALA